jgi:hypothetical protein
MADRPLLDFAHFDFLGLREELEGTNEVRGNHWVFPSLPQPVPLTYSAVATWTDLRSQYVVITLRVIREEPEGHVDVQFQLGWSGAAPYCRELPDRPPMGAPPAADLRGLRDLAVDGRLRQPTAAEPESASAPETAPAVTDRWRHTSDGAKVPSLMRLTNTGLFHPGYRSRQPQDEPPSIKIGMLVACRRIDPSSGGSELRAKFLSFLNSPVVSQLIGSLTDVAPGASWKNLAGHGPRTLEGRADGRRQPVGGSACRFGALPAADCRRGALWTRRPVSDPRPLR